MSVTSVTKDTEALTMSITARFDAAVERVWQVWADPRRLERWWGPAHLPRHGDRPRPHRGRSGAATS